MGISSIGAVGVPLQPPQALFPVTIGGMPQVAGCNVLSLPPGGDFLIPSGTWIIRAGIYSQVQVLDPVSTTWQPYVGLGVGQPQWVNSDGTNYRVVNPTGFPVGAMVNNAGTGYTSAPAVAANAGASLWTAIVGGGISAININSGGSGANYAVPPLVNIAFPPAPGVPASAVCAISGGLVTGFTIINPGAGYTSAPAVNLIPQQSDVNQAGTALKVTNALATAQLSFVGQVTAVILVNEGNNPLTATPALSITGGGGSGATATAVMAFAVTGVTVTTPGSGYATPVEITTTGGTITSSAAATNSPYISTSLYVQRDVTIAATIGSGTGIGIPAGAILDGGMFQSVPTLYATPFGTATGTSGPAFTPAVLTAVVGGVNDTVFIQPL